MTPPSRSRFPKGYSGFRPDLGEFLTGERKKLRIKQQTVAKVIGIARPSLSAIENGRVWPMPETMDKLADQLASKLSDIFEPGETGRAPRFKADDSSVDHRSDLGAALRAGRRQEKLKLWQVARKCNLSKAQLSRIERGEVTRSRFFVVGPQRLRFSDPELQRLADLAR